MNKQKETTMWTYKKQKQKFKGTYERDKKGERIFVLTSPSRRVTFESFQAARKLGWVYQA